MIKSDWIRMVKVSAAAISTLPLHAHAQNALSQGASISDRTQLEYRQEPLRLRSLDIFPSIQLDTEYNDNIFAAPTTPVDDVVFSITPSLIVREQRADRNLFIQAKVGLETYASGTIEDQFLGSIEGRLRLRQGRLTRPYISFSIARNSTRGRDSVDDFLFIAQPIAITSYRSGIGLERDFGPFTLDVEGRAGRTQFDGDIAFEDQLLDVGFRDFENYIGRAQFSYSQSPNQRIFVSFEANSQNFLKPSQNLALPELLRLDRSSDGYRAEIGFARQVTDLLMIDARVGYLQQSFDDPTLRSASGLSLQASAVYSPTPLTTLRATLVRAIDTTSNPLSAGLVRTEGSLRIDHELLRNLIVTASGRVARFDQDEIGADTTEWTTALESQYLLSRRWVLTGRVEHFERDGIFAFSQNRFKASLIYRF